MTVPSLTAASVLGFSGRRWNRGSNFDRSTALSRLSRTALSISEAAAAEEFSSSEAAEAARSNKRPIRS